jgi:hypothetical protein
MRRVGGGTMNERARCDSTAVGGALALIFHMSPQHLLSDENNATFMLFGAKAAVAAKGVQ